MALPHLILEVFVLIFTVLQMLSEYGLARFNFFPADFALLP
jgi:hypothetical protein